MGKEKIFSKDYQKLSDNKTQIIYHSIDQDKKRFQKKINKLYLLVN